MTQSEFDKNKCEWVLEHIDAYIDGDLSTDETSTVRIHLEKCTDCRNELLLAEAMRSAIRGLPAKECPSAVNTAVMEHITDEPVRESPWVRWWRTLLQWRPLRPAAIAAALVLVVSVSVLIEQGRDRPVPIPDTLKYSPEEVALAEAEVKWTLAYISQAGRRAGFTVRDKAIYPHVVVPVKEAVTMAGGGKESQQ
jgi:anti-sigma factor (TIGR02949 family)